MIEKPNEQCLGARTTAWPPTAQPLAEKTQNCSALHPTRDGEHQNHMQEMLRKFLGIIPSKGPYKSAHVPQVGASTSQWKRKTKSPAQPFSVQPLQQLTHLRQPAPSCLKRRRCRRCVARNILSIWRLLVSAGGAESKCSEQNSGQASKLWRKSEKRRFVELNETRTTEKRS